MLHSLMTRPVVTAQLSSRLIRAEDWFAGIEGSEGPAAMPPERDDAALSRALHGFEATIDWHVDRLTTGQASLRALTLATQLHQGQFMTSIGTTVAPRGELKGDLVLDARGDLPILNTSAGYAIWTMELCFDGSRASMRSQDPATLI